MKGDKAQTRPERRTPPLRETHEGRQMKVDKAQTRPERRTPPLRETHEGRQMKGDNAQTRPERRTPPFTREGGCTIQHRHTCGETMRDNGGQWETRRQEGGRTIQHRHTCGETMRDNGGQWETRRQEGGRTIQHRHTCGETMGNIGRQGRDKTSRRRTHYPTQAHMWGDNGRQVGTGYPEGRHANQQKGNTKGDIGWVCRKKRKWQQQQATLTKPLCRRGIALVQRHWSPGWCSQALQGFLQPDSRSTSAQRRQTHTGSIVFLEGLLVRVGRVCLGHACFCNPKVGEASQTGFGAPGLVRSLQLGGLPAARSTDFLHVLIRSSNGLYKPFPRLSTFKTHSSSAKPMVERVAKVVLFQDGSKVMQLEGVDAATVTADELQEALEAPQLHMRKGWLCTVCVSCYDTPVVIIEAPVCACCDPALAPRY